MSGRRHGPLSRAARCTGDERRRRAFLTPKPVIGHWVRIRIYAVATLASAALAGLAYKAYGLQVTRAAEFRQLAARQHLKTVEMPAPRGNIYDATGHELAVHADVDSVYANPRSIVDVAATAETLASALALEIRALEAKLASTRHFVWIRRHVTEAEAEAVRKLDLPGIQLTKEPRRYYPDRDAAGPVLGFAGIDGRGLDGLELHLDEHLVGRKARIANLRDAEGELMVADPDTQPIPGASITTTLHRPIQAAAERSLDRAIKTHDAVAATAIVMDVTTGDILAMANRPTFDPNRPGSASARRARNRAVTDTYEIGSIMKAFSVAAALEAEVVSPGMFIDTERGRYRIGRKLIRDSYHDEYLTVGEVIKRSSNVGAAKIAAKLGAQRLHDAFVNFGFGQVTDIELPGEQPGVLRDPDDWKAIGLATHSYGYGMTATPLQVVAAMAAIGNRGLYNKPRILKEIHDASGARIYRRKVIRRRALSEKTALAMWPMLESVFERGKKHGTGHRLEVPGYRVGGKTGTAHKLDLDTKTYAKDRYLSSFCGLAPIDDPKIAVLILVDEPRAGEYYGAPVAGPAWQELTAATLHYLGIPADENILADTESAALREAGASAQISKPPTPVEDMPTEVPAGDRPAEFAETWNEPLIPIPDFRGLSLGRAISVAKEHGVAIEVAGAGRASYQYPAPGFAREGAPIRVVFSHPR